ncbi:hypothetical protein [Actinomadura sediminis]|uniref:CopG family transcriptional regulator n=1 Tax=Actinomadura sediminis TaxID=1038904 RepID=A0ABW3ELF5_9ACTN
MVTRGVDLPGELDARLVEIAAADAVSTNTVIVRAVAEFLARRDRRVASGEAADS